jgi:hypothetical protein
VVRRQSSSYPGFGHQEGGYLVLQRAKITELGYTPIPLARDRKKILAVSKPTPKTLCGMRSILRA